MLERGRVFTPSLITRIRRHSIHQVESSSRPYHLLHGAPVLSGDTQEPFPKGAVCYATVVGSTAVPQLLSYVSGRSCDRCLPGTCSTPGAVVEYGGERRDYRRTGRPACQEHAFSGTGRIQHMGHEGDDEPQNVTSFGNGVFTRCHGGRRRQREQ